MKKFVSLIGSLLIILSLAVVLCAAADVEQLFEQGMDAFNSANYGSSELIFRQILDEEASGEIRDKSWFYLCRSIFQSQKYDSAIFEFNAFLNKCRSTDICIEARYWMGESYYYLKDYVKAIEQYKRYIEKSGGGALVASAHDKIGSIYYTQKRYDEALLEWDQALSKSDNKKENAVRLLNIGTALFRSNRLDEALERLSPLMTANAGNDITAKARLIIGQIYQIQGECTKALSYLNGIPLDLLKQAPYSEAHFFKALCYLALGNPDAAKTLLDLFIIIGKDSQWYPDALMQFGRILIAGNDEKSQKTGLQYLETARKTATRQEVRLAASRSLSTFYMERDIEKAIPYLLESQNEGSPEDQKLTLFMLGKGYVKAGNYDEAEKIFDKYIKLYPYDASLDEVTFLRARICLEKGDAARALELFESISKNNPFSKFNNESNYYSALVKYRNNDYPGALVLLNKYLEQKAIASEYEARTLLAEICMAQGNDRKAAEAVDSVVKSFITREGVDEVLLHYVLYLYRKNLKYSWYYNILANRFPQSKATMQLYFTFGEEFFQKKDYLKAEDFYKKYLTGSGSDYRGVAFFNRLVSLYHIGKYEDVISIIQKSNLPVLDELQWKEVPLLLSRSYYQLGDYEKVYNIMKNALIQEYAHADILLFIKSALKVGDSRGAVDASRYLKSGDDPDKGLYAEALFCLGVHFAQSQKIEEAKGYFSRIIIEAPNSPFVDQAKLELAQESMDAGAWADAIALLNGIADRKLQGRKIAMLILSHFGGNDPGTALSLVAKNLKELLAGDQGETVMIRCLEYHYETRNLVEFRKYAAYLAKYKARAPYVNYLSGKINYDTGQYKNAFYFFYIVVQSSSEYQVQSLLYLGRLCLLVNGDKRSAIWYFRSLLDQANANVELKHEARLNLAIILAEMGKRGEAKQYLQEIMNDRERGAIRDKAENLFEFLGLATTQ